MGTYVAGSTLVGAGLGLFASRDFTRGQTLDYFDGEIVSFAEARARDPSRMRTLLVHFASIDGLRRPLKGRGWASFANDARDAKRNNARFDTVYASRSATLPNILLRAKRDIKAGEEVLASYGRGYWRREPSATEVCKVARVNQTAKVKSNK